ncbi:DUF2968 domain-containing protein [Cupriavidus basilensis]
MLAVDQMVFYVAMSYQHGLWRVFRQRSQGQAEDIYARLSRQSAVWADSDIQRQILGTPQARSGRRLQLGEAKAQALSHLAKWRRWKPSACALPPSAKPLRQERRAVDAEGREMTARVEQLQEPDSPDGSRTGSTPARPASPALGDNAAQNPLLR